MSVREKGTGRRLDEKTIIPIGADPSGTAAGIIINFNANLRPGEVARELVSVEVTDAGLHQHDWKKKSLVTQAGKGGAPSFDVYQCAQCQALGKRFGLMETIKQDAGVPAFCRPKQTNNTMAKTATAADKLKEKAGKSGGKSEEPDLGAGAPTKEGKLEVVTGSVPTPEKSAGGNKPVDDPDLFSDDVKPPKDFKFTVSTKGVGEIIGQSIKLSDNGTALAISPDLPLEEWVVALDYFRGVNERSGWSIGDMLVFAEKTYGKSYVYAMAKTGRKVSTLKAYYGVAKCFPADKRVPTLHWEHHRIAQRVVNAPNGGFDKAIALLKDAEKGTDGEVVPTRNFKNRVDAAVPKKARKADAAKPGRKPHKPAKTGNSTPPPAREYLPEEQAALDDVKEQLAELESAVTNVIKAFDSVPNKASKLTLLDVILKGGNAPKKAVIKEISEPQLTRLVKIRQSIDGKIGYTA